MKKPIIAFVLIALSLAFFTSLNAQIIDDFSDENLDKNPAWLGNVDDFAVENEQLKLNGTGTAKSYLSLKADWKDTTSWSCYFQLQFSPSSSNELKIYLSFDNQDLTASGNGYFLKIGESGSDDNLELYKQSGTSVSKLGEGSIATMSASTNQANLLVTRSKKGAFVINSDFTGGNSLSEDFTITDNSFTEGSYFGFVCNYTSTRADKFLFDDVRIDPIFKDTKAPELKNLLVVDSKTLSLEFDESLDSASAVNTSNYALATVNPSKVFFDNANPTNVVLEFANAFVSGTNYTLTINNVSDLAQNKVSNLQESFFYFSAQYADVIINEIFPDPTPSNGLPESEFIELYNNTKSDIDLASWTIADASSETTFPSFILKTGAYLILCSKANEDDYKPYGNTLGISLPTLNNDGDVLTLRDEKGALIDKVGYSDTWYGGELKAAGGFTLERINPETACSGSNNWLGSNEANGGTPGRQNSVYNIKPDVSAPQLQRVVNKSTKTFQLFFNEPFDSLSATTATYNVLGIGAAANVKVAAVEEQKVTITLSTDVNENTPYTLEINGIQDCEGNLLNTSIDSAIFYLVPTTPGKFDLLISEIMADPEPINSFPAVEFVELSNVSGNILTLEDMKLVAGNDVAVLDSFILFPYEKVILCRKNDAFLLESYGKALGVSGFPSLSNGGELLELRNSGFELIHFVEYSDDWYGNELKKDGGYTLEMIDLNNPCGTANNWKGAKNNEYGTPGKENSVADENPDTEKPNLIRAIALNETTLFVEFDEICDSQSMVHELNYGFPNNNDFNITDLSYAELPFTSAILRLNQSLEKNVIYEIKPRDIKDCVGNVQAQQIIDFALPDSVDSMDVVINEVLFNPFKGEADFVELYNRSRKYLDLNKMLLATRNDDGELENIKPIAENPFLFRPGAYLVLTEDAESIGSQYFVENPDMLAIADLPTLADNEGKVVLLNQDTMVIDELSYLDDWHFALLVNDEGFSLERINPDAETQNEANWNSASSASGGATPTYQNSQFAETEPSESIIELSSESFSPDNDGFEDKLGITIKADGNKTLSLRIFDLDGSLVTNLVANDILGTNSLYSWDGFDAKGIKAPVGVYILLFEIADLANGKIEAYKMSVVLKGQL